MHDRVMRTDSVEWIVRSIVLITKTKAMQHLVLNRLAIQETRDRQIT